MLQKNGCLVTQITSLVVNSHQLTPLLYKIPKRQIKNLQKTPIYSIHSLRYLHRPV